MELDKKSRFAEKFVQWLAGIAGVIIIIGLIMYKLNNPEFKLSYFIYFIIITALIFTAIILASYYYSKKNKLGLFDKKEEYEKLPKPVTMEQCREIVKNMMKNPDYADYLDFIHDGVESYGKGQKSLIYTAEVKSYYGDDKFFIILNMHYPNERRSILNGNINPNELEIAKMRLGTTLEPTPDIREIKTSNPLLGTEQTIIETTKAKDNKEKDKEDEKSV
jgi:hypothetical protein